MDWKPSNEVISCMQSAFRRKWSLVRVLWLLLYLLQESLSLLAQQQVCRTSHAADASWNELVYRLFLSLLVSFLYLIELLKDSVSSILVDDSFTRLPSSAAQNAHTTATQLLLWCDVTENASVLDTFAADIWTLFNDVVNSADMLVSKLNKDKLWKSFHTLRTSESYEAKWIVFLKVSTTVKPCPIFYQYVSDYFFKLYLKSKIFHPGSYGITQCTSSASTDMLSFNEENALRYISGYVIKSLYKKVKRSSHPSKEELLLCLCDLADDFGDDYEGHSSEWTSLLDRSGALEYVSNLCYSFMKTVEICVRKFLSSKPIDMQKCHMLRET